MMSGVAVFNIVVFALFFPATVLLIWVILRNKDLWKLWAYRLIIQIAIADLRILLSNGFSGIAYFVDADVPETVARVAYLMFTGIIEMEVLFFVVLAFNRLFVILELRALNRGLFYGVSIIAIWCVNISVAIFLNTLETTAYYDHITLGVYFKGVESAKHALASYEHVKFLFSCVGFAIATVCYTVTISSICLKKNAVSKQEINLLIQAIIPFVFAICARGVQKLQKEIAVAFGEQFANILFNFFFRALPVTHLFVYLLFNRTIRVQFLRTMKVRKESTVQVRQIPSFRSSSIGISRIF